MRAVCIWTVTAMLAAFPAVGENGYIVLLRDGTAVEAQGPYTVEGSRALVRRADGMLISIPRQFVDEARTEAANSGQVNLVVRRGLTLEAGEESPGLQSEVLIDAGGKVQPKKVDNRSIQDYKSRLADGSTAPGAKAVEAAEAKAGVEISKADIMAREQKLQDMVNSLNEKIRQAQTKSSNYPASQNLQREIEALQKAYQDEWNGYNKMVEEYNRSIQTPKGGAAPAPAASGEPEYEYEEPAAEEEETPAYEREEREAPEEEIQQEEAPEPEESE